MEKLNKLYVTVLIVSNRTVKLVEAAINKEKGYYYRERNESIFTTST